MLRARGASYLRTNAFLKGVLGRRPGWKRVFNLLTLSRLLSDQLGRRPERLTIDRLIPGQSMTITTLGPRPTRRQRRKAKRRAAAGR